MQQSSVLLAGEPSPITWECDGLAHRFGNAVDNDTRQPHYPADMTDVEWATIRPLIPVPAWLRGRGGQPEAYCHRQTLDAIRYLVENGIKWRAMPADFPPWDRVYAFFRRWPTTPWSASSTTGSAPGSGRGQAGTRSRRPVIFLAPS